MFLRVCILLVLFINNILSDAIQLEGPIIGIDLGTTYSCVGIFRNGRVDIIQNDQGNRITPSYVAFTNQGERLIGDSAKNQLTTNPENTIFDVKRLIGRRFSDTSVQSDIKHWPFKVVNINDRPHIQIHVNETTKTFSPEEISAMILSRMKDFAEQYLQVPVKNVVVTVPAYFNDAQRQSTKDAGFIAGLNVVRIINEPTAAAIAYGLNNIKQEINILVYDLGGGTFDVSALTLDQGVFEVASTSGDTHLGGEDFDNRIIEFLKEKIRSENRKINLEDSRLLQKLRREAEKAKRTLSIKLEAVIDIETPDGDISVPLTRSKFEQLCDDLFKRTIAPLQKCITDSNINKADFQEILMVGGSTRIPKIQKLVQDFFNGKELNKAINPDEAVGFGAAVQAGILAGEESASDVVLIDVNPLSLGIKVMGDTVQKIVARNTKIPTELTQTFSTVSDNQQTVRIDIYEGERPMAADNHLLSGFDLTGIPAAPRGSPQIDVTFSIDANGILTVSAIEKGSGKANKIVVQNEKRQLKQEEIQRMIDEANKYAEEDKKMAERARTKSEFESTVYSLRTQIQDEKALGGKLTEEEKTALGAAIEESVSWLDKNPSATTEEIQDQKATFEKVATPIVSKYVGGGKPSFERPPTPEEGEE
ncbi:hypothetical protein HZS_2470, partial [Henneguya salminicola]